MHVCMCVCMYVSMYLRMYVHIFLHMCSCGRMCDCENQQFSHHYNHFPYPSPNTRIYSIYHIQHTSNKHLHHCLPCRHHKYLTIICVSCHVILQTWTSCARTRRCPWDSHRESYRHLGHHYLEVQLSSTSSSTSYYLYRYISLPRPLSLDSTFVSTFNSYCPALLG